MTTRDADKALDEALARIANDTSAVSPDFAQALAGIAQDVQQQRAGWVTRLVKAFGGWGFAAPQLAGLVTAAVLGVSTGQAQVAEVEFTDDEAAIMTAHVFGDDDAFEWLQ